MAVIIRCDQVCAILFPSSLCPFLIFLRIIHHIHRMPRTENVSF